MSLIKPVHAKVEIPGSKSISNRALLLAALAEGRSELHQLQISDDIRALIAVLKKLGVAIQVDEASRRAEILGCQGRFPLSSGELYCGESGTLARFMLTACAATPGDYAFDAGPSLRKRPMASLLKLLEAQGICVDPKGAQGLPLTLKSTQGLRGGEILVDASQTGQVVSALLMIAPFTQAPCYLIAENLVSQSYVELTLGMMAEFGVQVERQEMNVFSVPQPQCYQGRDYWIEPDFSTASYFFAAAAVTAGEVSIQAISRKTIRQGDREFLAILEQMGCEVEESAAGLKVRGQQQLQGVSVDMKTCPDVFMTLAAIAPFAETPTLVTGIAHARFKESDRLAAMEKGLRQVGVKVETGRDWFKVYPSQPRAGKINSDNDHRIAMAFSVIGLRVPGLVVENKDCVSKSCPEFFQLWQGMQRA